MNADISRRGLLGMFAAGVAAAVLPSGILMPVKTIALPPAIWKPKPEMFTGGVWFDASDLSTLFRDEAGTIPVRGIGDTVAHWKPKIGSGPMLFDGPATLSRDEHGQLYVEMISFSAII